MNIELRNNPSVNYFSLVTGLLVLFFDLYYGNLALRYGGPTSIMLLAILALNALFMISSGYRGLTKPTWFIALGVIYVKNLFGRTFVKHNFDSYRDLLIEKEKLFVLKEGRKNLVVKKRSCHPKDWNLMVEKLLQAREFTTQVGIISSPGSH